jgi:DNA-binding GntR family transcriptional regulator
LAEHTLESLSAVSKPQSLKNIAYRAIKDAILTLRFRPGQALSHRDLATQLQISETPIRDALQELEREGFVTRVAYKGTFVTEIDQVDIEETFQIRTAL